MTNVLWIIPNHRTGKHIIHLKAIHLEDGPGGKIIQSTFVYDELLHRIYNDFETAVAWYAGQLKQKGWIFDSVKIDYDNAVN